MKKKVFSLLLAGMLTFSMGTTAYATEDAIADMQAQKQQAEAGLAEGVLNVIDTVGCICQREGVSMHAHVVHQLGKLHFSPEVYQV